MSGERVVARAVDSAWRCDVCGERFTSNYMRQEHVQRDHPPAPSPAAAGLPLEDVERVARAIAASAMGLDEMDEDGWEYYLDAHEQEEHLRMAAAALAEMRPTAAEEAVCVHGHAADDAHVCGAPR